ncbi:alkaline phosphatase PhoX [Longispora albida]|uniref:alkaline phosphatase PhoX n=1 Tax=Longispora albida TaxID=203523 RepID=UPI0003629B27|nr:alkaline phosphatase PhoX [Longispora albida]
MTSPLSRRSLLRTSAAGGLGIVMAGSIEAVAGPQAALAWRPDGTYGELVADPRGLLALPPGFRYEIVAQAGVTRLESGEPTPASIDGMGWFRGPDGTALVCNHEQSGNPAYRVPALPGLTYDPAAPGGTTNLEADRCGLRIREYVSLAGTLLNCAGGVTPWKTWLTCEETEQRAGAVYQKDHGYVFEVDPLNNAANLNPVPLKFLGRFAHEAVAVDPVTHCVYETEDANNPHGGYYRWTPPPGWAGGKGKLRDLATSPGGDTAGTLQAMKCTDSTGKHVVNLAEATVPGTTYAVTWVDVPDRDARVTSVRKQFTSDQVTRARKLEGAWWGENGAYFVSSFARRTDGSPNEHDGQVWLFNPDTQTVTLKTIFGVNPNPEQEGTNWDGPDNITVSPYGGVILAEDGDGVSHLVGINRKGKSYPMARNDLNDSEFAGPVFSGDARILFANIYSPGYVLAIMGPWGAVDRTPDVY